MNIRPYNWRTDAVPIHKVWEMHHNSDYSIPSLDNTVTSAVVHNGADLVAFGMVKLFAEALIVMNMDCSKRDRVNAMKMLFIEAFRGCRENKLEQLHVSVTDNNFADLLIKQYNFKDSEGRILVVEV